MSSVVGIFPSTETKLRTIIDRNESGWNTLVGADTNKIISSINNIHIPGSHPDLYGSGSTAEQICTSILV